MIFHDIAPRLRHHTIMCNIICTLSLFHGVAFTLLLCLAVNIFPDAYIRTYTLYINVRCVSVTLSFGRDMRLQL